MERIYITEELDKFVEFAEGIAKSLPVHNNFAERFRAVQRDVELVNGMINVHWMRKEVAGNSYILGQAEEYSPEALNRRRVEVYHSFTDVDRDFRASIEIFVDNGILNRRDYCSYLKSSENVSMYLAQEAGVKANPMDTNMGCIAEKIELEPFTDSGE